MAGSADPAQRPRHVSGLWRGEAVPAAALADSVRLRTPPRAPPWLHAALTWHSLALLRYGAQVPVNPIVWSLTLLHPSTVSAFGAGFFEDAGDVPGEPVLMYTLRGEWQPGDAGGGGGAGGASSEADGGAVRLVKEYTSPSLFGVGPTVRYDGRLVRCARRVAAGAADAAVVRSRSRGSATARGR